MRTSSTQFQLLVEFMEKYGDLSKPSEGPRGRVMNIQRWDELTNILNSESTGDTKTADKWRKEELNALPPTNSATINIDTQLLPEISFAPENWNRAGSSREPPSFPLPAAESEIMVITTNDPPTVQVTG